MRVTHSHLLSHANLFIRTFLYLCLHMRSKKLLENQYGHGRTGCSGSYGPVYTFPSHAPYILLMFHTTSGVPSTPVIIIPK